ncbi:ATP-grasp domain-containing protein [Empedobacter falsenii]
MKIAILGASYLQLPLVEKAKANGIETHCFAWDDGKAVCKEVADYFYDISVLEKETILEKCQEINIDGILTIATDICVPTISYVAAKMNLIGNSLQTALLTTNKGLMRDCFHTHNIPSPAHRTITDIKQLSAIENTFPLIVKPVDRSGSLGVKKVSHQKELLDAVEESLSYSFEKTCIVEEYISGVEVSVETLSWKGEHQIVNITDKVLSPEPYFVEIAHHQPTTLHASLQEKIKKIALNTLRATNIEFGASHIEMKITEAGNVYVIEIGSRMGGDFIGSDLVKLSTGIDYLQCVLDIALNQFNCQESIPKYNRYAGVYFYCKETQSLNPYFQKEYEWTVKKEILNDDLKLIKSSNDRSGYLIYQSDKKIEL